MTLIALHVITYLNLNYMDMNVLTHTPRFHQSSAKKIQFVMCLFVFLQSENMFLYTFLCLAVCNWHPCQSWFFCLVQISLGTKYQEDSKQVCLCKKKIHLFGHTKRNALPQNSFYWIFKNVFVYSYLTYFPNWKKTTFY